MFDLSKYKYELPERLITAEPREPRDSAKLLVYNTSTDEVFIDTFINISKHLPEKSLLVLNNTKVLPARAEVTKETGGKVEVLFLVNELEQNSITVKGMVNKKLVVGEKVSLDSHELEIVGQDENVFEFKPLFEMAEMQSILFKNGKTPIPKYLGKTSLTENQLRDRYQTVFAQNPLSVAAPTASLHFTERVFESLQGKGIERVGVTLHVGMGTFAPVNENNFRDKKLHTEYFEIPNGVARKIAMIKGKSSIVAVGTTSIRTLESAGEALLQSKGVSGKTNIFIFPPYEFKVADALITNFHLPESSLMCLVDAFLQFKKSKKNILDLYKIAIENEFHFYSFGDSMLII